MTRYSLGTLGLDRRGWYVMRAPQSMQYLLTRLVRGMVCPCPAGICVLLRGLNAGRVGGGGRNRRRWSPAGRWRRPRRREPARLAQLPCYLPACAPPRLRAPSARRRFAWHGSCPYHIALEQVALAAISLASRVLFNSRDLKGFLIAAPISGQNCGAAILKSASAFIRLQNRAGM